MPHLTYDPTLPAVRADPYPYYASLRAHDPIQWNERLQVWIVARHADVVQILRDPSWSSNYLSSVVDPAERAKLAPPPGSSRILLFLDAPEHTELRHVVGKCFTMVLPGLGSYARVAATELLESFQGRDEIDLVYEFAAPLSLRILARMLGVPDCDRHLIAATTDELSRLVDWTPSANALKGVDRLGAQLTPYLLHLVEEKRSKPGDDLVSAMLQHARTREIRYADVIATSILMVAAGHVTSTHMLGNGILALLRDRQALQSCRSGQYPTVQLVDELLRFDSPVQITPRTAVTDLDLKGRTIRRGEMALALLGSANRDDSVFEKPDTIDPSRRNSLAISFGGGPHFCIGASLARVSGAAALEELFARYPRLGLPEQLLEWKPTITQRGLVSLRVTL